MTDLNDLLDAASGLSAELAARAEAGAAAAHEVVEQAHAIGLSAVDQIQQIHQGYAEVLAALEHAGAQSTQAAQAAAEKVHASASAAAEAGTAIKATLDGVEGEVVDLSSARAGAFHVFDASARQVDAAFNELSGKVETFEHNLNARAEEVKDSLQRLDNRLELTQKEVEAAQQHLQEEVTLLGAYAAKLADETAHDLEQILAVVSYGVVNFANNSITNHNQLTAAVREGYLQETKDAPDPESSYFDESLDLARSALGRYELVREPAEAALGSATTAFVDNVEKAVTAFGVVTPALQAAHEKVSK